MLSRAIARASRPLAALVPALLASLMLAASPAAAQVEIAPPYNLTSPGPGALVATPAAGFSTIAITVVAGPTGVVFTPGALSAPAGCTPTGQSVPSTTCAAASMSGSLTVTANVVQVDIRGVATNLMTIQGGADTDAIAVQGPAAPAAVNSLVVRTGPGGDDLTIRGNVVSVDDTSTLGATLDTSPDRYVVEDPGLTGHLEPAGGDDLVTTDAPGLTLDGADGNDTLTGPGPLVGGPGNDLLKPTTPTTSVAGGPNDPAGADRVSYERVGSPLSITLTGAGAVSVNGSATVTGVEDVEGGSGNDSIVGDDAANVLAGGAGDDTIDGRGGVDDLDGGVGSDTVSYASEGAGVVVSLGAGTGGPAGAVDVLHSFEGVATGAGNDLVSGTAAPETFTLGAGDDQLNAGEGDDTADGGEGNDLLRGGAGRDTLSGGPGTDTVTYDERTSGEPVTVTLGAPGTGGGPGEDDVLGSIEDVIGTPGPDTLTGDDGPNGLFAGAGRDTLSGLGGDDAIYGGDSRDVIDGGPGRDQLFGEGGDDSLAAFDNEADLVDCGESLDDDAQVDPADTVVGCEYSRRLDIPIPVDADQDGAVPPFDCNDTDPAINPGATDVPADGIDQNCDGFDEQLAFVGANVNLLTRPIGQGRRIRSLSVTNLEKGSRLTVTCTAPKAKKAVTTRRFVKSACAFKTKTKTAKLSSRPVAFTPDFRNRLLPAGTQIEVRITVAGRVGKVWIYRINSRTSPHETRRCLTKGNFAKPQVCPPEEA
jgi:Ca2+-binding RTX toxin-like protein